MSYCSAYSSVVQRAVTRAHFTGPAALISDDVVYGPQKPGLRLCQSEAGFSLYDVSRCVLMRWKRWWAWNQRNFSASSLKQISHIMQRLTLKLSTLAHKRLHMVKFGLIWKALGHTCFWATITRIFAQLSMYWFCIIFVLGGTFKSWTDFAFWRERWRILWSCGKSFNITCSAIMKIS